MTIRFYMKDNLCTVYKLWFHRIQRFLIANGWVAATEPQEANVLIAGVCAAFEADENRSCNMLHSLEYTDKELYVIGCMVKVRPDKMPCAHLFYSWQYESLAAELIRHPAVAWDDIELPTSFRSYKDYRVYNPHKHFVGISTGCAFSCSYCPHRIGAGDIVSRPMVQVVGQVEKLIKQGTTTIVLTGIDTASYGRDIGSSFPTLIKQILTLTDGQTQYHVAQFNPEGITARAGYETMVQCCCDPRITDLQLPIQTSSRRLLALMNRNYAIADVARFVAEIRQRNSKLLFRTDLMVGFPTETEDELRASVDFVARYFNEAAVYRYEHKICTPIAKTPLPLFGSETVNRRMEETVRFLREAGLLVHSGGQSVSSLMSSDKKKEQMRAGNILSVI